MALKSENTGGVDRVLRKKPYSVANHRWKILANAIRGKKTTETENQSASVRRFESFGLLHTSPLETENTPDGFAWFKYTCPNISPLFTVDVRQIVGPVKLENFMGFNNTGNVCVWPSEEILAYYCLNNEEKFRNKRICELGGGMTCLAGVMLAATVEAEEILLTDGNEESVDNLSCVVKHNEHNFKSNNVSARVLRWDEHEKLEASQYDFIICADCLFFDDYREGLANTIHKLLKPGGEAIIFAPERGSTLKEFVKLVSDRFTVDKQTDYDKTAWQLHLKMKAKGIEVYDENLHYPVFIHLSKS